MRLIRRELCVETHQGSQASGVFYLDDNLARMDKMLLTQAGQVKLIYMDPPYLTGDKFHMRVRMGSRDWQAGRSSLVINTYSDRQDRAEYLDRMREILRRCHALLREDGVIFVHIDFRLNPYMRLLLDEVFGEENFLNEIIWSYQSGGRSTKHFSRKHDVILFYARGSEYDFDITQVMVKPEAPRTNHMRRHVDSDGRVYRSIKVGDKVYTYYDDDPVAPSDVWSDVSHLQQRDPERTGYDTQKPLALLDRIVRCASRPGDIVMDPFCGSATALEAAARSGRDFIGIDTCRAVTNIVRRRLYRSNFRMVLNNDGIAGEPVCRARMLPGVGFYHVTLEHFEAPEADQLPGGVGMDAIDSWSVGYIRDGEYIVQDEYVRTKKDAELRDTLDIPAYPGQPALCVNDVLGRSFLYEISDEL